MIANHFDSKGGDQPLTAATSRRRAARRPQRHQQAAAVDAFVDEILRRRQATPTWSSLGDINDFEFSPTVDTLDRRRRRSVDLIAHAARERAVQLRVRGQLAGARPHPDQPARITPATDYDIVHINAEFADQASDHDPQVVKLRPSTGNANVDQLVYRLEDIVECLPRT